MKKQLLGILCFVFMCLGASAQTQVLADTSLEASGPGGAPWGSTSTNFGTVLCDAAACGNCGGPCVPNAGSWYAWFGGTTSAEEGTITQTFNVPSAGFGNMKFFVKVPMKGTIADSLWVLIDGQAKYGEATDDSIGAYTLVQVNLGSISSGSHTITIKGKKGATTDVCNVLVDDVALTVGSSAGNTEIDFSNGVSVFANNENHFLNLAFNLLQQTDLRINITDMMGRTVYTSMQPNSQYNSFIIPVDTWVSGVYNITITEGHGYSFTKKVYVQN